MKDEPTQTVGGDDPEEIVTLKQRLSAQSEVIGDLSKQIEDQILVTLLFTKPHFKDVKRSF